MGTDTKADERKTVVNEKVMSIQDMEVLYRTSFPLEVLESLFEERLEDPDPKVREMCRQYKTILGYFDDEEAKKLHFNQMMVLCEKHGMCLKIRAKKCEHYDPWTVHAPYEADCEWCMYREEL